MLMIGSEELAKRLYEVWRRKQDLIAPVADEWTRRDRPRRSWDHIGTVQQTVWREVADEAGRVLADAMGSR
jgi:hypothetical protein